MQLDSVQIGVADLAAATHAYTLLLGVAPVILPSGTQRFQFTRGAVEIEAGRPGFNSVRFAVSSDATPVTLPESCHGLQVRFEPAPHVPPADGAHPDAVVAIDHLVVRTTAPERAIALWRDRLGVRLALDREFPARGLRLLFFRSGGITLEYAAPLPPVAEDTADQFYGLSYRVANLQRVRERLAASGIDVSDIRPGMRPHSSVLSVRSGTCGVPTLLLEEQPS